MSSSPTSTRRGLSWRSRPGANPEHVAFCCTGEKAWSMDTQICTFEEWLASYFDYPATRRLNDFGGGGIRQGRTDPAIETEYVVRAFSIEPAGYSVIHMRPSER